MTIGEDVILDDDIIFKRKGSIIIGNYVSVDKGFYCTTQLSIGDYIHISPYVTCIGGKDGKLTIKGFNNIMAGARIICGSDRFDNSGLFGAMIPEELKGNQIIGEVIIEEFANVGTNAVILPNSILRKGALLTVGSVLIGDTEEWGVYKGNPAKLVRKIDGSQIIENAKKLGYDF
jgi:acetyltransferase-like isoleucine patch superfamily enzyme